MENHDSNNRGRCTACTEPALRIARQRINQLLTKTADPKIRMTKMAAKEMTARLEGEVAALRTVAELPA
jgi:hypothetical protein